MVWTVALSIQDQVDKVGAYVGIASFIGLAVLSLLYFAQAREVRRLRDWAGRAPERAQEIEARVLADAEARRAQPEAATADAAPAPAAETQPTVVAAAVAPPHEDGTTDEG